MRASDLSASLPRDEPDGVPDGLVVVLTVGAIVLILFLREAQAEVIRCNLLGREARASARAGGSGGRPAHPSLPARRGTADVRGVRGQARRGNRANMTVIWHDISCTICTVAEMPISEAREHISELVGRARYAGEETILTHYGAAVAVVISIEEYQRLKHARGDSDAYDLPPEIQAQVDRSRAHPERDSDRLPARRTPRQK
jgi:prevent-host-death family protein